MTQKNRKKTKTKAPVRQVADQSWPGHASQPRGIFATAGGWPKHEPRAWREGGGQACKRASVQSGQTFFDTIPQKCSWIIAVSCKFAIADSRAIFLETSLLGGNTHTWYPRAYAHTHIRTNPHEPRSTIWIPNIYHPDYAPVAHNTYIRSHRIAPYHIALNDHENGPIATGTWPVRQRRASSPTRRSGKSDFFFLVTLV